ncbi:hypothetical protein DL240_03900 [Lujinxingia litoralis]|uniref:Dickkopf N-terminal cysteine-rich domain-containing protein n=1 Tax=Lujinxingia litoralis TaxID=2211119 RepID=A0A328CEJ3_9DELT|nr:hypothetical protein [Lujinxingia litoralis]RAL25363.1 hypothetical protein DL240_03900 [Lujinxingia litoralis]
MVTARQAPARHLLITVLAMLMGLLFAGCSGDGVSSCASDSDCFSGESCLGGSCTALACFERGRTCSPDDSLECCEGLYCAFEEPCNVSTEGGCRTEGSCRPKLAVGQPCDDASQCADPQAVCSGSGDEESTCTIPPGALDGVSCQSSAECSNADGIVRSCDAGLCKRAHGEPCSQNSECSSNLCDALSSQTCLGG